MSRTRIKICGVKDVDTALAAADAGADAIGLVFVEKSPRYIHPFTATQIVNSLPTFIESVGLFVNKDEPVISGYADEAGFTTVQLHGTEPISFIQELRTHHVFRVIKAIPYDANLLNTWRQVSGLSAVLIDAPPKNGLTGGSGDSLDWNSVGKIDAESGHQVILAGGLTPDNVGEAIRTVRPYAVDVSSGVESSRGVKDVGLIKAFCEAVRQADSKLT